MAILVRVGSLLGVGMFVGLSACTIGSPTYVTATEASEGETEDEVVAKPAPSPKDPDDGGGQCDAPLVKVDVSKLTACEGGKGHCYAKDKVGPFADKMIACANSAEVCVPDEVLVAGGGKLKSCKSVIGDGACFTATLVPEIIQKGGSALTRDVCDADQLCLPCVDPTSNNAPTPFCQPIGVAEKSCGGGGGGAGTPPAPPPVPCCTTGAVSSGVCISETAVPEGQRDDTKQDVCAAGNKCVPKAFVDGKPVKCDAGIMGSGVCLDKCFNDMMKLAGDFGFLSTKGCGSTEVCVPCAFGKDQGMPGCT